MNLLPNSGTADMDSLAALDALLKLNAASNEQQQMMDQSRSRPNLSETLQRSILNGLPPVYPSAASSLAARLVSAQGLLAPPSPSSAAVALNRAADLLSWPSASSAGTSSFLGGHQFSPTRLAAAQAAAGLQQHHDQMVASRQLSRRLQQAVEEERRSVATTAAAGLGPGGSAMGNAVIADSSTADRARHQREDYQKVVETSSTSSTCDTPSGAAIRAGKVEEALRSKSQRGKKRDDLSEKERVELTRTRNREHAKSTR
jgi:hypothetical protein